MTNEHAIELAFIQRTLERFPRRVEVSNVEAGNVSAIREALDKAHRVLHCAIIAGILRGDDAYDAMNMAAAALSAPARNCDVFGSEAEAKSAFIAYYNEVYDLKGSDAIDICDLKHDVDGILHDYIQWLFAPAKSETKGEADGSGR